MRLHSKFAKILAAALIVISFNLPILAQFSEGARVSLTANLGAPSATGILSAVNAEQVYVNGNRAADGITILPGAQIETAKSSAVVTISGAGKVEICPQSKLKLAFANDRIEIELNSGNARIETAHGASGEISLPGGESFKTDATGVAVSPAYASGCRCRCGDAVLAVVPTISFLPFGAIAGIVGASALIAAIADDDDSFVPSISQVQP